jgi:hypothetical protein
VVVGQSRCVGPAIGTSGGGGLARRATTTSATVAVLAVVATAITVFVVVLVSVAIGATVFTIGRARRCGRWWLGHWGCSIGVECHRGSQRPGTVCVNLL